MTDPDAQAAPAPPGAGQTLYLAHSPADGTTVHGSHKGDGAFEVLRPHGFRAARSGYLYVRNSRGQARSMTYLDRIASVLCEAGFVVEVDLDNDARQTWEDGESERAERAEARIERREDIAARAGSAGAARIDAGRRRLEHLPFGQPVMDAADARRRQRVADQVSAGHRDLERAGYHRDRAEATARNQKHRLDPRTTERRLKKLRADLRRTERELARMSPGSEAHGVWTTRTELLGDQIRGWGRHLAQLVASGEYKPWRPQHFQPGDVVRVRGHWVKVHRVNRETLTVDDLVVNGYTQTTPYDEIFGRIRDGVSISEPPPDVEELPPDGEQSS